MVRERRVGRGRGGSLGLGGASGYEPSSDSESESNRLEGSREGVGSRLIGSGNGGSACISRRRS